MDEVADAIEGLGMFAGFWAFVLCVAVRDDWLGRFDAARGVARAGMVAEAILSTAIGLGGPLAIASAL